MNFRKF